MFAQRLKSLEDSKTSGMRNRAKQLISEGKEIISFASGELGLEPPYSTKESIVEALENRNHYQYSDTLGIRELRELIAERVSKDTGVKYSVEEVGVTVGAKQALFNAALALFDSKDEVIILTPAWGTFCAQVVIAGAKPVICDTSLSGYEPSLDQIKSKINDKTKAIIVNSPNNPTGMIYREEFFIELAEMAHRHNLIIIFDECYSRIVYSPYRHYNIVNLAPDIKKNTIIINSFSKECALAGWRIGYIAASKEIIDTIKRLQGHMTSNPCSLVQYGVLGSFGETHDMFLKKAMADLKEKRDVAVSLLKEIEGVSFKVPQGTFYIFLDVRGFIGKFYRDWKIQDINSFSELLLQEGHIATVSGDAFGSSSGIRLSISIPQEKITEGIGRMEQVLKEIH